MADEITTVKAFTLHNDGAFVARIRIHWINPVDGSSGDYEPSGYHDICAAAERTLNLSEAGFAEGTLVRLHAVVVLGKDKDADRYYSYSANGGIADYTISGTTLINSLKFNGLN